MSTWGPRRYVQFLDGGGSTAHEKAVALALQLGADFNDDGTPTFGSENYVLGGPFTQWIRRPRLAIEDGEPVVLDAGEAEPGEWWTLRLSTVWEGHDAAVAALQAAGVLREPAAPSQEIA